MGKNKGGNPNWVPGVSGNPGGRPARGRSMSELLRRALRRKLPSGLTAAEAIAAKVLELALDGERWAVELIYDRMEGKPAQSLSLSGDEKKPVRITYVDGNKEA